MQWVASTLHTTSEHGGIQHYYRWYAHLGCQQSTELTPTTAALNGLVRFARKTKSGFCACVITFQLASTNVTYHTVASQYRRLEYLCLEQCNVRCQTSSFYHCVRVTKLLTHRKQQACIEIRFCTSLCVKAWNSSEMHLKKKNVVHNSTKVHCFSITKTNQSIFRQMFLSFRRVRKVAKSDYQLCQFCLSRSVRPSVRV